jgi:hypothetical protein
VSPRFGIADAAAGTERKTAETSPELLFGAQN